MPNARDPLMRSRLEGLVGHEITVPGSTSNLGPGFDVLGLALRVSLRVRIASITDDGGGRMEWRFTDTTIESDNAIDRGFRAAASAFLSGAQLPSLVLDVRTEIPMRAGLGSSAAALVAGLRLAEALAGPQPDARLLTLAGRLEGHPDNTSASILGGFIVATALQDGSVEARSSAWPEEWPLIVATPTLGLETKVARAVLPGSVPLRDAIFNLQRTACLVAAIHGRDAGFLRHVFGDRLHQPYRAKMVPGLPEALSWSGEGLLGVFLSGAGPSIAAVVDERVPGAIDDISARFHQLYAWLGLPVTVRLLRAFPPIVSG